MLFPWLFPNTSFFLRSDRTERWESFREIRGEKGEGGKERLSVPRNVGEERLCEEPVTIGLIFRLLGLGLMFSYYLYIVVLSFRNKTELYNYTIRGLFPVSEQRVLHGGKRSV